MTSRSVMETCADLLFTDALQDMAQRTGRPVDDVREELIVSGAYAALYDFETDLWQMGPDYFVSFHDSLLRNKTK